MSNSIFDVMNFAKSVTGLYNTISRIYEYTVIVKYNEAKIFAYQFVVDSEVTMSLLSGMSLLSC